MKHSTNVHKELFKQAPQTKAEVRSALVCITSLRYLAQQGAAVRGHTAKKSNFVQLLQLHSFNNKALESWLCRTEYK